MAYKDRINLDGTHNARDIGGYPTADNKTTKLKRFVRTDGLHDLTDDDVKKLLEYGVSVDIDLRGTDEVARTSDRLQSVPAIKYVNINLLGHIMDVIASGNGDVPKSLGDMYIATLKSGQEYFKQIFKLMLEDKNATVLFHCSAGKDRTGMVAAMLLMLAGVEEQTIIEDYAISARYLSPIMDQFSVENDASLSHFLNSDAENIKMFIDAINKDYGGIEAYLKLCGLRDEEITNLRASFVE
ncbi:tyrosine-protein phosphatase [Culicoidibacter larvae]|uniref:Tyrosine-protein phosphatase n=1 Tax=Culicoidibacter larvae TaxID=2579976 RepID=A0A5R8QCH7_9FIRM|nr:tyrosine-protein phosphatase [Culicoidibacter larvae]TLG74208.1 tyrosine-protein phosphatase [Culicoidibacter larvae]